MRSAPPRPAVWLLRRLSRYDERFSILDDLDEDYQDIRRMSGPVRARVWYWGQALHAVRYDFHYSIYWRFIMLSNYIKLALRNLWKHKGQSLINITGLAIGMACCLLILIYVRDELSYDNFHLRADRIHRVVSHSTIGGTTRTFAPSPPALAPALAEAIPEIEMYTRIFQFQDQRLRVGDDEVRVEQTIMADPDLFRIFSFDFISGDPETALQGPESVVLTESTAVRLFGEVDVVGRVLTLQFREPVEMRVTSVVRDVPVNSHIQFDMVQSTLMVPAISDGEPGFLAEEYFFYGWAYLLLKEGADALRVEHKVAGVLDRRFGELLRGRGVSRRHPLQKLRDIHLTSGLESEIGTPGNMNYIYLFSTVAVFVLLIAGLNFINLSTARSAGRAREVGLRKVFGAFRTQLVRQFLCESVVLSLIGLSLGVFLALQALPVFNSLTGKTYTVSQLGHPVVLLGLLAIFLLSGLAAGSFPAFVLSAFRPVGVLRGRLGSGSGRAVFRKVLVVVQFSLSVFMIASILTILKQLDYVKNKDLGFDRDRLVVIRTGGERDDALKARLLQNPNVESVAFAINIPGRYSGDDTYRPEGKNRDETVRVSAFRVGYDFLETFGMSLVWGRDFDESFTADVGQAVIINEAAARDIGWEKDAVGRTMINVSRENRKVTVVGVVRDFHHKTLKLAVNPTVLRLDPSGFQYIAARVRGRNLSATLAFLESTMKDVNPERDFIYHFVDEDFREMYQAEERVRHIYTWFGFLAVFVACLGLYGLAAFTVEQRTKEIGVRKVLGASVGSIVSLLSRSFMRWVLIANLIGWPLAWLVMDGWLDNFAYRIPLSPDIFLGAALLATVIFLATVAFQTVRAARLNPTDSLRWE